MSELLTLTCPVTPFQQNCTLIFDDVSRAGVVVDPGGDFARVHEKIVELGLNIEAIWLTHGHIDHVGAASKARAILNAPIIGPHKGDEQLIARLAEEALLFTWPEEVTDFSPDRWLSDGDELSVAGHKFTVIHAPGHTPGHIIYFSEREKLALVGDVLFKGSIGRTDFPGGDSEQLIASITKKLMPLGDDVTFIPGHGPSSTLGYERTTNPFLQKM